MDRLVSLERPTTTSDEAGAPVTTWAQVAQVWAEVIPVGARERIQAPEVMPELTSQFRIRHRTDVESSWRIIHDGKAWLIQGISEIGRREGLELSASVVG